MNNDFTIYKNGNFTCMLNYHFKEKNMTLKAKGLLSLMLSLPEDWDYSIAGLVKLSKDGKDSVMSALKELESFGYLTREIIRNDKGQFDRYKYSIYDKPFSNIPSSDKPHSDFPNTDNPQQLNTNRINICNKLNTNGIDRKEYIDKSIYKKSSKFVKPTLDELKEYCSQMGYKVDAEKFFLYYEQCGWTVGKNKPMKDWRASLRLWNMNQSQYQERAREQSKVASLNFSNEECEKQLKDEVIPF